MRTEALPNQSAAPPTAFQVSIPVSAVNGLAGSGLLVWLAALWGVGWAAAARLYSLVQAFKSRR